MAKRLVPINYTAGISSTMFIYQLGWLLAEKYRVLLVDADPKCDLTSLMLREDFDEYYSAPGTRRQNIKDATSSVFRMDSLLVKEIDCVSVPQAPGLHLVPGHPNMAEYDFYLSLVHDANQKYGSLENTPGALNHLIRLCERKYDIDFTLINLASGVGGINQNLFINSDVFVVPTIPGEYALQALKLLKGVLGRWLDWKNDSWDLVQESAYQMRPGTPKFGGTVIHQCNYRNGRVTMPRRQNTVEVKSLMESDFIPFLAEKGMTFPSESYPASLVNNGFCLQEVPDFSQLAAASIEIGIPAFALSDREIDGIAPQLHDGNDQRKHLRSQLESVADHLVQLLNHV